MALKMFRMGLTFKFVFVQKLAAFESYKSFIE